MASAELGGDQGSTGESFDVGDLFEFATELPHGNQPSYGQPSAAIEDPTLLLFEVSNKYNCTGVPLFQWNLSHVPYTFWHTGGQEPADNSQQENDPSFLETVVQSIISTVAPQASIEDFRTAIIVAIYIIVSFFSIVGNALILGSAVATRKRKNKSPLFVYQCNLALAGMIVSTYCIWTHVVSNHLGGSIPAFLAPIMCQWNGFVQAMTLVASTLTLTAIAFDRFVAIVFPFWRKRQSRGRLFWSMLILGIWFMAASVSAPFAIFRQQVVVKWRDHEEFVCEDTWPQELVFVASKDPKGSGETWCKLDHYWRRVYYTIIPIIMYFLPMGLMTVCYVMIVVEVWRATKARIGKGGRELAPRLCTLARKKRLSDRTKTVKTAVNALAAFAIGWTPLQVFILYTLWMKGPETQKQQGIGRATQASKDSEQWSFETIAYLLAYSQAAVHPFLYGKVKESAANCFNPLMNALTPLFNFCTKARTQVRGSSITLRRVWGQTAASTTATNAVVLYSGNRSQILQSISSFRASRRWVGAEPSKNSTLV